MNSLFSSVYRVGIFGALFFMSACDVSYNGPELKDKDAFLGCYSRGSAVLFLSKDRISIGARGPFTKISRLLFLKNNATVNTVNNLEYDPGKSLLKIGQGDTGFFYGFDDQYVPKYLSIPDSSGVDYRFYKSACRS